MVFIGHAEQRFFHVPMYRGKAEYRRHDERANDNPEQPKT